MSDLSVTEQAKTAARDAPASASSFTLALIDSVLALRATPLPDAAVTVARQCILDWLGVAIAARHDPIVSILLKSLVAAEAAGDATLIGTPRRVGVLDAALVNGAMGHALDYDDVLAVMGHPTAPVAPAALALGETRDVSGVDLLTAFVLGVEAESRIGLLMGQPHYAKGWHTTATIGTFGATVAAGHILGLDREALARAFGVAGVQAAGLKGVFGTMSKPFQVGKAAQNGLTAALLGAAGFTSDDDTLASPQGFANVECDDLDRVEALRPRDHPFVTETLFKLHAACYLTHNTIEAARSLRPRFGGDLAAIEAVEVSVLPRHLGVCNIEAPRTGLECKFSLRMTCALALAGEDTSDENLFSDATAARPELVELRRKTVVTPDAPSKAAQVTLTLRGGEKIAATADVGIPATDLAAQQERIEQKFRRLVAGALTSTAADEVIDLCRSLDRQPSIRPLMALVSRD